MNEVFSVMKFFGGCGTVLLLTFVVLLAMPNSKLRAVLLKIVGWAVVVLCIFYGISPIDILPEAFLGPLGLIDDVVAIGVAIGAASAAMQAGHES
jgi:uncharacterized membrane protein YkvA (DUF1232 family)